MDKLQSIKNNTFSPPKLNRLEPKKLLIKKNLNQDSCITFKMNIGPYLSPIQKYVGNNNENNKSNSKD